ncbi:DUF2510 domain-containing protein [Nocardia callitridis]|uniref:DUF2510 domain-containing protein n=1 Tax=Nocardia callitridis TaxID=648753 RepID=UPI0031EDE8C2
MGALSIGHTLFLLTLLVLLAVGVGVVFLISKPRSNPRPGYPPPNAMAPGWYPDNANPTLVRWFDGYRWTDYTQPRR